MKVTLGLILMLTWLAFPFSSQASSDAKSIDDLLSPESEGRYQEKSASEEFNARANKQKEIDELEEILNEIDEQLGDIRTKVRNT